MDQQHIYWKQRAHSTWLTQGDRNTKFFHAQASERRKKNHIDKLLKDGGDVVAGKSLKTFIANQYQDLFMSNADVQMEEVLGCVHTRVSHEMNECLEVPFSDDEVWKALQEMGDLKAPGADGIPSIFYKRFWSLVGDKLKEEVLSVLNGGRMPRGWNDTVIVLIPKVNKPEKLKDLRPISLCNVAYKLISKAIANRMKTILPEIISQFQSAFVPGRLITDNVLVAYELTHYLKQRRRGKEGVAAIKLDMSKAYDRVEWIFLKKIMEKLGFSEKWINLIMMCVTTVSYHIKVNDEYTTNVTPQRGLRQGDPLSPYLFIICAEALSALLQNAESEGKIQGIKICEAAPRINHLFFADDSLILMRARKEDASELQRILHVYERASGQLINRDKSSVLFSPNTDVICKAHVREELHIGSEAKSERYLGLPVSIGKSRKKAFEYIKRRIWGKN